MIDLVVFLSSHRPVVALNHSASKLFLSLEYSPPCNWRSLLPPFSSRTCCNQSCFLCCSHVNVFLHIFLWSFSSLESHVWSDDAVFGPHYYSKPSNERALAPYTLICVMMFLSFFISLDFGLLLICGVTEIKYLWNLNLRENYKLIFLLCFENYWKLGNIGHAAIKAIGTIKQMPCQSISSWKLSFARWVIHLWPLSPINFQFMNLTPYDIYLIFVNARWILST